MTDKSGSFFLFLSSFLCVGIVCLCFYKVTFSPALAIESQSINEYSFSEKQPITDVQSETSTESSDATPVVTEADAVGKAVSQFLTPYKSTGYNNVYIKNKAEVPLDIAAVLSNKPSVSITDKSDEPQVLIIHTHTTESYLAQTRDYYTEHDTTRTTDTSHNVTAAGAAFAKRLNEAGINTLHDTTVHDSTYTGSYSRSAETIKKYLETYPSIKVVVDLHRDSISAGGNDRVKPVREIDGKNAAQVMLVIGCGQNVSGFENWQENLRFALKYQQTLEVLYPGLARAATFLNSKYNQHLSTGSILLEVGTEVNSVDEAVYGATLAADALAKYLNTLKE